MIEVLPNDPAWLDAFERIRLRIAGPLEAIPARIEHVGSTSVPGLRAKPILDIDVVVPAAEDVPEAIRVLGELGYGHRGDLGIAGREAFEAPADGEMTRHVYLVVEGSTPYRDHVDFRDYLRTHPATAQEYGVLKSALAVRFADDRPGYTDAKAKFVQGVLRAARDGRG